MAQAIIAGFVLQYMVEIHNKKRIAMKTANYAKLLLYTCNDKEFNYYQIATKLPLFDIENRHVSFTGTLSEQWNSLFRTPNEPDDFMTIGVPILNVLDHSDSDKWNELQKHFMHLPSQEFEMLHRYFCYARRTIDTCLSPFMNQQSTEIIKVYENASVYSKIVCLYLSSLIIETERPFVYCFPGISCFYKNQAYTMYTESLKNFESISNQIHQ